MNYLELIHDSILDPIILIKVEDKNRYVIVTVNKAFLKLTGYNEEQVVGQEFSKIFKDSGLTAMFEEALHDNKSIKYQSEMDSRDGEKIFETMFTPISGEPTDSTYLLGVSTDITEHKRASRTLEESEGRLRLLAENLRQGMVIYNREYDRIVYFNQATIEILDVSKDKLLAGGIWEALNNVVHEEEHEDLRETFNNIFRFRESGSDEIIEVEFRIQRYDAEVRWIDLRSYPLDSRGNIGPLSYMIFTDVTDRKKIEDALRKRLTYEETLSYCLQVLLELDDAERAMNYVVGGLLTAFDASRVSIFESVEDPLEGKSMLLTHEAVADGVISNIDVPEFKRLRYDEFSEHLLDQLLISDVYGGLVSELPEPERALFSSQNVLSVMMVPVHTGRDLWGVIGVADCLKERVWERQDMHLVQTVASMIGTVLERRKAEEALRAERNKAQKYLDVAGVMMVVLSPLGEIMLMNQKGCEVLEYSEAEVIGKKWFDNFLPEYIRNDVKLVFNKLMAGDIAPVEYFENSVITRSGKERLIAWHNTLLKDEKGNIVGTLSSGSDITERKEAEEALNFRLKFENLITSISTSFVTLAAHEIDVGISSALQLIGEFADVDRSYVFLYGRDGKSQNNTHEWCAEGIESQMQNLQGFSLDKVPWSTALLKEGKVVYCPRVADMGAQAEGEKEEWQKEGIKSLILVPMVFEEKILGFVGFDSVRDEKTWSDDIISLMRIVGEIFANALERKWSEEKEKEYIRNLSFLSKTAMEFVGFGETDDIYHYVAEKLKELVEGSVLVAVTSYDASQDRFTLRELLGLSENIKKVLQIMGGDPVGMSFTMREESRANLLSAKLYRISEDLDSVTSGGIPRKLFNSFRNVLGISDLYAMGFSRQGKLLGSAVAVMRKGSEFANLDTVEAFINQAAVALQRRLAEKALRESEERFRGVFENSMVGIYRTTPDGRILMANPVLVRMLGYSSFEELARCNLEEEQRSHYAPQYTRSYFKERIECDGQVLGLESIWIKKDDTTLYVRESARAVRDKTGKTLYYEGTVEDITERRLAEEALRESEERYRAFTEEALVGIYIFSEGRYLFVNPAMEKITGYSHEELLKLNPYDLALPEDREFLEEREKSVKEGRSVSSEYTVRIRRKDGCIAILEVRTRVIQYEEKTAALGNCVDITELMLQRERIERAKKEWENTFDSISDLVMVISPDHIILRANRAVADYLNLEFADLIGRPYFDVFPAEDCTGSACSHARCMRNKQTEFHEFKDPRTGKFFYKSVSPLLDRSEKVAAMVEVARDITDIRLMREALVESESKFRRLAESVKDIIFSFDLEGNLRYASPAVKDILGEDPADLIGTNLFESPLFDPAALAGLRKYFQPLSEEDQLPIFEVEVKDSKEHKHVIEIAARRLENQIVGVARDITERKNMEQQLIRASKLASIGVLAAGIAHQVNNPLAIMLSTSTVLRDLLEGESQLPEDFRKQAVLYLDMMDKQVDRTRKVVSGLLAFTQARRSEVRRAAVNHIVDEVLQLYARPLFTGKRDFELDLTENLPEVLVDPIALQQVIVNLLQNALDATEEKGKIVVRTEEGENVVRIVVTDTGSGVPVALREKIFEPLFSTKTETKGTGLGLSISVMLLESFDGRIMLEDTPGGGATFIVEVPKVPEEKK